MIKKLVMQKSGVSIIIIRGSSVLVLFCYLLLGLGLYGEFKINLINSSENVVMKPKSMLAHVVN